MTRRTTFSALALAVLLAGSAAAQNPPAPPKPVTPKPAQPAAAMATHKPSHRVREAKPGLLKKAKITPDAAEQTALAAVPGGSVTARKIETEKGVLVYAFNIKTTGMEGYNRVTVDATTGALVANTHKTTPKKAPKKP
ncbi:MAG TPA: PepSY domain-containing protein [Gemmatimonadales bacterium]|jgi:uncharacterized membrane protein YkoI|nr:PepSY domain-containing protein [Gemmatimonadales bacterium]